MQLKAGEYYNLALQKASFRDLYRTGIFSKVDFELEKTEDPAQRVLVVTVAETRAKEVFFEPGWGSYEKLRLRVGFQEKNLFGTGRIFRTQATGSLKARGLSGGADPKLGSGSSGGGGAGRPSGRGRDRPGAPDRARGPARRAP